MLWWEMALVVASDTQTPINVPGGCTFHLKPDILIPVPVFGPAVPGQGELALKGELPIIPIAFDIHVQMVVGDPVAPAGFVTTNGVTLGLVP